MIVRLLSLVLTVALLSAGWPAVAQTDILNGEPIRPRRAHPGTEPEILNAPHAPRQDSYPGSAVPMDIYITPQIGTSVGAGLPASRPQLPVTRQITSPTSSAIRTAPSGARVTPTGRP